MAELSSPHRTWKQKRLFNASTVSKDLNNITCSFCQKKFTELALCLQHEINSHPTIEIPSKKPKRKKTNSLLKMINDDEQVEFINNICEKLTRCKDDDELKIIFDCYRKEANEICYTLEQICTNLKNTVQTVVPFKIHTFGSIAMGLGLNDSDYDLYLEQFGNNLSENESFFNLIIRSMRHGNMFFDINPIRRARVPIIKCIHRNTNAYIDINVTCKRSTYNTKFMKDLLAHDKRLYDFALFLKIWAKEMQIIGKVNMTSYCLLILIIFFLQHNHTNVPAILPSIECLQAGLKPVYIIGVNYAYKLNDRLKDLPHNIDVPMLLNDFFQFYHNFNFENAIIAPFLGQIITLKNFNINDYKQYKHQLLALERYDESCTMELDITNGFCIQDPFCLNTNVAKRIRGWQIDYVRGCMRLALDSFHNTNINNACKLYKSLLLEMRQDLNKFYNNNPRDEQSVKPSVQQSNENNIDLNENNSHLNENDSHLNESDINSSDIKASNKIAHYLLKYIDLTKYPDTLLHTLQPSRHCLKTLQRNPKTAKCENLYKTWSEISKKAVVQIIKDIYCINVVEDVLELDGKNLINFANLNIYDIFLTIDTWTLRRHGGGRINFWSTQMKQTEKFLDKRSNDKLYKFNMPAKLIIRVHKDLNNIDVIIELKNKSHLYKKHPVRKFFMMFKNTMQCFNLDEYLVQMD